VPTRKQQVQQVVVARQRTRVLTRYVSVKHQCDVSQQGTASLDMHADIGLEAVSLNKFF